MMKTIDTKHLDKIGKMGFKISTNSGVYWFAHAKAQEGFSIRNENDEIEIRTFAFINGEQIENEASSEVVAKAVSYMEKVYGIDQPEKQQKLGPHATIETPPIWQEPYKPIETSPATVQPDGRSSETSIITENDFALQTSARSTLLMMQRTDPKYVQERKGPKGSKLHYVDVQYMTRALNFAFAFDWSFDVVETRQEGEFLTVLGKLTVNMDGIEINKTQWGSQQLRAGMELGDGLKAATSDALKKCASMFGIAADVYAGEV